MSTPSKTRNVESKGSIQNDYKTAPDFNHKQENRTIKDSKHQKTDKTSTNMKHKSSFIEQHPNDAMIETMVRFMDK